MNKANKLTVLRMLLIIPFLVFLVFSYRIAYYHTVARSFFRLLAIITFVVATITDYYDGKIARETNTVSDFGKLLDPIADKLLTFTALLVLLKYDIVGILVVLILLSREFLVTGLRALVISKGGEVIPASSIAKLKTFSLFIALFIIMFLPVIPGITYIVSNTLLLPSILLSILSCYEYIKISSNYIEL